MRDTILLVALIAGLLYACTVRASEPGSDTKPIKDPAKAGSFNKKQNPDGKLPPRPPKGDGQKPPRKKDAQGSNGKPGGSPRPSKPVKR